MKEEISQYLFDNIEHLLELTQVYRNQKNALLDTDPLFKEEIISQYNERIRFVIGVEITRDTGCSYEEALIVMEEIEIDKLFGL